MHTSLNAKIHITGIVQGVGFRPFIFSLANRFGLNGWVRNSSSGVDIEADGEENILQEFIHAIQTELPPLARVDTFEYSYGAPRKYTKFEIIQSEAQENAFLPVSPDVAVCEECLEEMNKPSDRRYRYPFINCTNCGPRYTIITDIPYDRPNTTMAPFEMCPECEREYRDPLNRRFHAQPVACHICGPKVWLECSRENEQPRYWEDDAIIQACKMMREGRILAIKGLGGFHLACDATNYEAVSELRRRKLRIDKPFALMMKDVSTIKKYCFASDEEISLICSRQRPIVLLEKKPETIISDQVSPGLNTLGVMLPYTPLHYLLFSTIKNSSKALVMTSGNISEEPISVNDEAARMDLSNLADAFLMHDRLIRTRCDDSVFRMIKLPHWENKIPISRKQFSQYPLRRSRGYAPDPIRLPFSTPAVLAVGPELKNTFCLTRDNYAFISHHVGDMENYETLKSFEDSVLQLERLFRIKPLAIFHDLHPDYLTTRYALSRAAHDGVPNVAIQHHHAHIAACMTENSIGKARSVIGLALDGTGYGTDGAIWGGEIMVADYIAFERRYHMEYFPLPGGDASIRHPARTALALLWALGFEWEQSLACVMDLSAVERATLLTQLKRNLFTLQTSSMGRLFDAVASLSGVRQRVNYEAQAAIEFETAMDPSETGAYNFRIKDSGILFREVISSILTDVHNAIPIPVISARFHNGLAEILRTACSEIRKESKICDVVLSGGVWQNMHLLERTVDGLEADGFTVFLHQKVPTNDGGISLGQAAIGTSKIKL